MIRINGQTFHGHTVSVINGKMFIDGKAVTDEEVGVSGRSIVLNIEGHLDILSVDDCDHIAVSGSVGSIQSTNGSVTCGDVAGAVTTVNGNVLASAIHGKVSTLNGNIKVK